MYRGICCASLDRRQTLVQTLVLSTDHVKERHDEVNEYKNEEGLKQHDAETKVIQLNSTQVCTVDTKRYPPSCTNKERDNAGTTRLQNELNVQQLGDKDSVCRCNLAYNQSL